MMEVKKNTKPDKLNAKLRRQIIVGVLFSLLIGILIFGFYFGLLQECRIKGIRGDHLKHIDAAVALVQGIKGGRKGIEDFEVNCPHSAILSYPVWHVMIYGVFWIKQHIVPRNTAEISIDFAVALVNSMFIICTFVILFRYFVTKMGNCMSCVLLAIICVSMLFVGPLDASRQLNGYYLGGYTGNIWHNPTYITVRPLALIVFLLYSHILSVHKAKKREYIVVSVLLTVSAFFKPNFYQCFVPGLVVYCIVYWIIKRSKEVFWECLRIAGTCIPIGLVAVIQYTVSFSHGNAKGIGIRFLYVWKHFTTNWKLSLVVSVAFPFLIYLIQAFKKRWNVQMTLSLCMFGSAILQYMFFYVIAGPFSGDFSWGVDLSIFICFVIAMERLVSDQKRSSIDFVAKILCFALYSVHLYYGIFYFYTFLVDMETMAISI